MPSPRDRTEIFEKLPVPQAVCKQIIPAIASQMITLIYNLADTYFVGLLNQPHQTAAITVASPSFLMLTAISNLFGVGGASAIARALGRKRPEAAGQISALAFWFGLAASLLFSVLFLLIGESMLRLSGATVDTMPAALAYTKWVIVIGGPFNVLNTLFANLVRSEGNASAASFGVSFGGVCNIFLDPIFVLPQFLGLGAAGAGIATAISNLIATLYFLRYLAKKKDTTVLSIRPKLLRFAPQHLSTVLSIGFPSALQYALTVVATASQARFVSKYPTEAVAALGIVKKLDQLPLFFSIGTANGLLPLLAYNHAAGNYPRRRKVFHLGCAISVGFSLLCLVAYELFAPNLTALFIDDPQTITYAAGFLRRMVTAMPMMAVCYPMIIQFQAMGKARESLVCSILRKGVLDIPLLFLMDGLFPLYGCMWVQPIVDSISLILSTALYLRILKHEKRLA